MAEAIKEQLQEQLTQVRKDLEAANSAKSSLQEQLTAVKEEKADLQAQLTDERTRSGEVAGELNEAENLIEELQGKLKTAEKLQAESDTVIVSDGFFHYKVLAPKFKHKHEVYEAKQLQDDEELVRELVAADVGFLQKIDTGEVAE